MVIFLLLFITTLFSEEPTLNFWFENSEAQEEMPIIGNFIITHEPKDLIDESSFLFDQKKIIPSILSRKKIGPTLLVETYQFTLPALLQGEYPYQGLQVKVGGEVLRSRGGVITVKPIEKKNSNNRESDNHPFLELTKLVEKPSKLYPGMEIMCGYRYRFHGAILLKEEVIPLVDSNPFEKRGDKIIEDGVEGIYSIRTVKQKFQVISPGLYKIPESRISGYSYTESYGGRKILLEPKIVSTVPSFTIEVESFPDKGKPPFFNGILGPFSVEASLLTPPKLMKGDVIRMKVTFKGNGEAETLKPPDLLCQPGFNYLFSLAKSAPIRDKNSFIYEMRAQQTGSIVIPEIILSTFIAKEGQYEIIKTKPIPIEVEAPISEEVGKSREFVSIVMNRIPFSETMPFGEVSVLQGRDILQFFFSSRVGYLGLLSCLLALFCYVKKQARGDREK